MFSDPLSVTYDGNAKSLPRVSAKRGTATYRTADGEFAITIADTPWQRGGVPGVAIELARRLPDLTPANVFDDYREIVNAFAFSIRFDPRSRAEASVDLPRLRTALDSFVTSTVLNRLITGEK